jgi:hypothetical protein
MTWSFAFDVFTHALAALVFAWAGAREGFATAALTLCAGVVVIFLVELLLWLLP